MPHKIGIVMSGSAAPGKLIIAQSIIKECLLHGTEVFGAIGFAGLYQGEVFPLEMQTASTAFGKTAAETCATLSFPRIAEKAAGYCVNSGLNGLIVIGGDGTLRGADQLSRSGIRCIFVPATIMNNIGYTDYCIGYDSALNAGLECLAHLEDTLPSGETCYLVEVPGETGKSVAFARALAKASEALDVLRADGTIRYDNLMDLFGSSALRARKRNLIIVPEGLVCIEDELKALQLQHPDIEFRHMALTHILNRSHPTAYDSILARELGAEALQLLMLNSMSLAVGICDHRTIALKISEALEIRPRMRWPVPYDTK